MYKFYNATTLVKMFLLNGRQEIQKKLMQVYTTVDKEKLHNVLTDGERHVKHITILFKHVPP